VARASGSNYHTVGAPSLRFFFGKGGNCESMRFMTPDWAAKPVTVPYAKFGDPQTLNLYSYVENGPLNRVDTGGHNFATPMLMALEQGFEAEYEAANGLSTSEASEGHSQTTQPKQTSQTQQSQPNQSQNQSEGCKLLLLG
jgi:hypothetical protein